LPSGSTRLPSRDGLHDGRNTNWFWCGGMSGVHALRKPAL